ncbi:MAG: phosphoadenosine phosphosulfate reductase [Bacteroidia bacterium]|nr:MAG: phosphoadenosine phosphosulfate reductase [Bacteroidia bacterium]
MDVNANDKLWNEDRNNKFRNADFQYLLAELCEMYPNKVVFSTSFNIEDQVITHFIAMGRYPVEIFTLDTGRMFQETYNVWSATEKKYGIKITSYFPDAKEVEELVKKQGINGFYESVENRKECCHVRKIQTLQRALKNKKVWITGVRSEHSEYRKYMNLFEWDDKFQIIKFNPLIHWTTEEVMDCIRKNDIPYNSLYDKGFKSIGCAPCTRAIKEGEPYRSGRWWWENSEEGKKECGLHLK